MHRRRSRMGSKMKEVVELDTSCLSLNVCIVNYVMNTLNERAAKEYREERDFST